MGEYKFEDKIEVINRLLAARRKKWTLTCVSDMDFSDVEQIIKTHIWSKWHLWDQTRPLENWISSVASNQIANLLRANYLNVAPPCSRCPMNQGGGLCGFTKTGEQCAECPMYKKWQKSKENGYNIKLAQSINNEDSTISLNTSAKTEIDWEEVLPKFHDLMKKKLPSKLYQVYKFLYIRGRSEEELATILGFKTTEKNKVPGYKQIYNFKQKILAVAKEIVKEEF